MTTAPRPSLLLAIPLLGALALSCAPAPRVAAPRRLRVLTWNVQYANPRHADVVALLRRSGADLVCLQEVTPGLADLLRADLAPLYPHLLTRPVPDDGSGYAVLSRWPFEQARHISGLDGGRPAGLVKIECPDGGLQLLNVHLTTPPVLRGPARERLAAYTETARTRLEELRHFCAVLDPAIPAVVVGDFNSLESEPGLAFLIGQLGLADAWRARHPDPSPDEMTWRTGRGRTLPMAARIDYVFASAPLIPVQATILETDLSDHCPLLAVFEFSRATPSQPQETRP